MYTRRVEETAYRAHEILVDRKCTISRRLEELGGMNIVERGGNSNPYYLKCN